MCVCVRDSVCSCLLLSDIYGGLEAILTVVQLYSFSVQKCLDKMHALLKSLDLWIACFSVGITHNVWGHYT